jgi:hypothetical protein
MKTSVIDMKGPSNVTAWALLKSGELAGRLICNWSDNRVCTALVQFYGDDYKSGTGRAGGYGYDKLSSAVYSALKDAGFVPQVVQPGNGLTRREFEAMGFDVVEIL